MRIVFAPPGKCAQKLERGELKRTFATGPLLGYTIACPECRYPGTYLHDDVQFIEGATVLQAAELKGVSISFMRPATLSAVHAFQCWGCARMLTLRADELEARP